MSNEKENMNNNFSTEEDKADIPEYENIEENMKTSDGASDSDKEKEENADDTVKNSNEESVDDESISVKYMRLAADFQNFKRRADRQRSEIYARANEKIVTELLDVLDNFERALSDTSSDENEGFKDGMEMIFNQLKSVMENVGVKEIEAEGIDFDPNFHNAVMMEDTDKVESGKVSCVLQKGYTLNDRVVRAAMVKVAN